MRIPHRLLRCLQAEATWQINEKKMQTFCDLVISNCVFGRFMGLQITLRELNFKKMSYHATGDVMKIMSPKLCHQNDATKVFNSPLLAKFWLRHWPQDNKLILCYEYFFYYY